MIAAVRALVSKELQQHKSTFFWLACFSSLVTWLLFRIYAAGGQVLSYLSITSVFAVPVLLIIAFVIGQRLIAVEYYGQTQRFIEALPIRHGYVQWVKYWVGLLGLLVLMGGVWVVCVIAAKRFEMITQDFIALMALRLSAFVFAVWSMVFTFSLLGRLRIPLIAAAALAVSLITTFTPFELNRFGPFALMDQQLFAFERKTLPTQDLIETLVGGAVMLAIGMWLARMRDGSFVETLATPISTRAKGFLITLAVITLGIYSYFGPQPAAEPFAFSDTYVATDGRVEIAYLDPQFESDAETLMNYLTERIRALNAVVPISGENFLVRVSLAPVADATEYSTEQMNPDQGVVVSANFDASSGWYDAPFGAYMFHQIFSAKSDGRLLLEPHHWLLDGFSRWWAAYGEQSTTPMGTQVDPIMLEALYATRERSISERLLQQWDISSEELGETVAMSVAYSGWRVLQEHQGTAAALQLAQQELTRPSYGDARDWWNDWRDPPHRRFARATGWNWTEFVATWDRRLNELRSTTNYERELDAIAKSELTITPEIAGDGTRSLRYLLRLDRPLPANTKCIALHTKMPNFERPVARSTLREAEVYWPGSTDQGPALSVEYSLAGEYGPGTRVFAAFECQYPQFPAPLHLGSSRLTMP